MEDGSEERGMRGGRDREHAVRQKNEWREGKQDRVYMKSERDNILGSSCKPKRGSVALPVLAHYEECGKN